MKTHPYQKTVTTHKTDVGNHFIALNYDAVCNAFKNLKPTTCLVWMYFCKNKTESTFNISKAHMLDCFGITPQQYRTAMQELIEKKYLIKQPQNKNHFDFYDIPHEIYDDDQWRYDILPL